MLSLKKSKLIGIALLSMLLLMPMQTVSANDYFSLNSTNNTWTGAQKKNDWANAVVNLQSGLGLPWSSVRLDVMTDQFYGGVRESATAPITATSNAYYDLYYYSGYGTMGQYYRLDSWAYSSTNSISGIWAP